MNEAKEETYADRENLYFARVKKLANDHWSHIEGVLIAHGQTGFVIDVCKYHYLTAFLRGYKHAIEDSDAGLYDQRSIQDMKRGFSEEGGLGGK